MEMTFQPADFAADLRFDPKPWGGWGKGRKGCVKRVVVKTILGYSKGV